MGQNPSQLEGPGEMTENLAPDTQYSQLPTEATKKKKSSHTSKHKMQSETTAPVNGLGFLPREEDTSKPSKRKREPDPERKKKKKKHRTDENDVAEAATIDASIDTMGNGPSANNPERPAAKPEHSLSKKSHKSAHPKAGKEVPPTTLSAQAVPAAPASTTQTPSSEHSGTPANGTNAKKARGSRPSAKHNLKIGFFTADEVKKLEDFKVDFCTVNGLSAANFDAMVQHSERDGTREFPCPAEITTKFDFWAKIYEIIPDRDRRSVYRFMRRHFQDSLQKPHEWTDEQDEELIALHAQHGPKWAHIAKIIGRSDDDVTQRWKNRLEHRNTMNRGAWSESELRALMDSLQDIWNGCQTMLPQDAGKDVYEMDEKVIGWGAVSNGMRNVRSRQQCADKWRKIRRRVLAMRAAGDPDAVFDLAEAEKTASSWNKRLPSHRKSREYVVDSDGDEEEIETGNSSQLAPKRGSGSEQRTMALAASQTEEAMAGSPSLSQADTEPKLESESDDEKEPIEAESTAAGDDQDSSRAASTPPTTNGAATPPSGNVKRQQDTGQMAQIKEKTTTANKSKKRKRSGADHAAAGVEEPPSSASKQQKREEKKEKKRKKKERKEAKERARKEAEERDRKEAEERERMERKRKKKEKKEKKKKKLSESAATIGDDAQNAGNEASLATDRSKKHKKHKDKKDKHQPRETSEPNGATDHEAQTTESPKKKHPKKTKKKAGRLATPHEDHSEGNSDNERSRVNGDRIRAGPDDEKGLPLAPVQTSPVRKVLGDEGEDDASDDADVVKRYGSDSDEDDYGDYESDEQIKRYESESDDL